MDSKSIANYYDNLIERQLESGINDRIYLLFKKMIYLGLKSDSNVLELGSGIGAMTFLLSRYVKKGKIETVDISTRCIEFSRQRIKKSNVLFFVDDIVNYKTVLKNFDFITLFDVIEHIPVERHDELFHNIATILNENTRVLINIPNPDYIRYDQKNNPETLQIIDQPLELHSIIGNLEKNGLSLSYFQTYSIWVENDYQFFVVTKKKDFKEIKISDNRNVYQKALKKLERIYVHARYSYR